MKIGIVGHEKAKFTPVTESSAKKTIRRLLNEGDILVSGGCHLGGIDIWAEEISDEKGLEKIIHYPEALRWSGGFRERNLKIAEDSDIVHCIVVEQYPEDYGGMRFDHCYHCNTSDHIKSGGCWTAKRTKNAVWHIIKPDGEIITR